MTNCFAPEHAWIPMRELAIRFCGHCGKVRAWRGHPKGCDCECHRLETAERSELSRITACGLCGWRLSRKPNASLKA